MFGIDRSISQLFVLNMLMSIDSIKSGKRITICFHKQIVPKQIVGNKIQPNITLYFQTKTTRKSIFTSSKYTETKPLSFVLSIVEEEITSIAVEDDTYFTKWYSLSSDPEK